MYWLLAVSGIFKAKEEEIELWPWLGPRVYEPCRIWGLGERAAPAAHWGVGTPAHIWFQMKAPG